MSVESARRGVAWTGGGLSWLCGHEREGISYAGKVFLPRIGSEVDRRPRSPEWDVRELLPYRANNPAVGILVRPLASFYAQERLRVTV